MVLSNKWIGLSRILRFFIHSVNASMAPPRNEGPTMKTLLQITSSLHSSDGASSRLAARYVAAWRARHPNATVVERDLAADTVPHLTADAFAAFAMPAAQRTGEQALAVAFSDA